MDKIDKYLGEASEVPFDEFDKDRQKFVTSLVGKKEEKKQQYFDGIHGKIINFNSVYGNRIRLPKKDLKKIMNDKNVRWVDITAIGL